MGGRIHHTLYHGRDRLVAGMRAGPREVYGKAERGSCTYACYGAIRGDAEPEEGHNVGHWQTLPVSVDENVAEWTSRVDPVNVEKDEFMPGFFDGRTVLNSGNPALVRLDVLGEVRLEAGVKECLQDETASMFVSAQQRNESVWCW